MLKIKNTLTGQLEEFKPIKKNGVSFYQCGPTVYWTQHIGNLRGMTWGDLIVRVFKFNGYDVVHVRNYTDVGHLTSDTDEGEDKMEKGAKRENATPQEIAEKYIKIFEEDTRALNLLEPSFKPRATGHIQEMIEMVKKLVDKGFAYSTDLAIYFETSKAKDYTRLSGQKLEENIAGAGIGDMNDPAKRNPADFVLWFFKAGKHKNALQHWPSPFKSPLVENGEGFPGWHIECSAMSKKYLEESFDVHMGGIEHIPVHHTNEIAQSESANGAPFVKYWIHNEHLTVEGQKMAKSEGTAFSLAEVKEKGFSPMALRYFFLQAHYRSKQNFTWEALGAAQNGLERLYNQIRQLGTELGDIDDDFRNKFLEAVSDDFNVPQGLALIPELLKFDLKNEDKLATLLEFDKVFGLEFKAVLSQPQEPIPDPIKKLVQTREEMRKKKNWAEADKLRVQIEQLGYTVEDTIYGPDVKKI